VQKEGVLNTNVTLTGSSQIALARNPRSRSNVAVARRDPSQQQLAPQYDAVGDPVVITPQMAPGQVAPQARADDGYIYPADGSSDAARYPAPRSNRRVYDAQGYGQQGYGQQQYYAPQYAPQVYAPRPSYQPRGLFTYQN
jgi:hypothetical protein